MKAKCYLLILFFLPLLNCDVVDELTKFDLDYDTSYTLNPVPVVGVPVSLFTSDIETNTETTFENNNTNANGIESIKLKSLKLVISSPETGNFNFLKYIQIYISTENVEEVEIANLFDIQNTNANSLELNTINVELKNYLQEDAFKLRIAAVADETTSEFYDIDFFATFKVDAKVLGI
ncbi:hypothetical protein [Algibacter luteus]|uniref:DUF1735 domain-containing protein n=1 Tax=Algibacter luteus TaxID=1178825 RepID=A0A1M6DGE3_9FLAO|nr:hypothetical protein [Algibacter luteus]SHI72099.1 hypothetical protein SAMN05216261_1534 [Algibacter luteus]